MGIEAVQVPVGVRLDVPVPLAVQKQSEQSMAWVAGFFHDFPGLPFTPPDTEALDGRELSSLVLLMLSERLLLGTLPVTDPFPVVSLIVGSDQVYHRRVVIKLFFFYLYLTRQVS
jgi:hypothetical protein